MQIQWFPGHMTKALRQMKENLKLIDLVVEVLDARIPKSSHNPDLAELAKGRSYICVLSKPDLADPAATKEWIEAYQNQGIAAYAGDLRSKKDLKGFLPLVREACKEKIERNIRRGFKNRPIRAMIVGIPNTGKSTMINSLAGRNSVKTGNRPGVTKGKQWISLGKGLDLLDTPGVLWPKFEDDSTGVSLALIGSINSELYDHVELASELIFRLETIRPQRIAEHYGINPESFQNIEEPYKRAASILEQIAEIRRCLGKGGKPEAEKAADILLNDFRSGTLGRITLERP